jgi:hypothetical protein
MLHGVPLLASHLVLALTALHGPPSCGIANVPDSCAVETLVAEVIDFIHVVARGIPISF